MTVGKTRVSFCDLFLISSLLQQHAGGVELFCQLHGLLYVQCEVSQCSEAPRAHLLLSMLLGRTVWHVGITVAVFRRNITKAPNAEDQSVVYDDDYTTTKDAVTCSLRPFTNPIRRPKSFRSTIAAPHKGSQPSTRRMRKRRIEEEWLELRSHYFKQCSFFSRRRSATTALNPIPSSQFKVNVCNFAIDAKKAVARRLSAEGVKPGISSLTPIPHKLVARAIIMRPPLPVIRSRNERMDRGLSNGSIASGHSNKCNGTGNGVKVITVDELPKSNGHVQ